MQVIASGLAVNIAKFADYTKKTAEKYVSLYGWYYMPASVHKILIHGADVIENAILPIGQLSEEAQESRNKDFKRLREFNCRKVSRRDTNIDLLNNLIISSDPLISNLRHRVKKHHKQMFPEVLSLTDRL